MLLLLMPLQWWRCATGRHLLLLHLPRWLKPCDCAQLHCCGQPWHWLWLQMQWLAMRHCCGEWLQLQRQPVLPGWQWRPLRCFCAAWHLQSLQGFALEGSLPKLGRS